MILQTVKKGTRNCSFEESKIIFCFDVEIKNDDIFLIPESADSDEELQIRGKNHEKVVAMIKEKCLCRDNIEWMLGDKPLEENTSLAVVTLDTVTYVYSKIGTMTNTMVYILNDSGKTVSRVM